MSIRNVINGHLSAPAFTINAEDSTNTLADVCESQFNATPGNLDLGQGFDPLDPRSHRERIVDPTCLDNPDKSTLNQAMMYSTFVSDEVDRQRLASESLAISAQACFGVFQGSASFAYSETTKTREQSKSASWVFVAWNIKEVLSLHEPHLSLEAQATKSDSGAFAKKYGTEYVSKVYRGAELQVWFTAKSSDYGITQTSSARLAAAFKYALFNASGSGEKDTEVEEFLHHVDFDIKIYVKGGGGLELLDSMPQLRGYEDLQALRNLISTKLKNMSNEDPVNLAYVTSSVGWLTNNQIDTPEWVMVRDEHVIDLYKKFLANESYVNAVNEYQSDAFLLRNVDGTKSDGAKGLDVLMEILGTYKQRLKDAAKEWLSWQGEENEPAEPVTFITLSNEKVAWAQLTEDATPAAGNNNTSVIYVPGTTPNNEIKLLVELDAKHPKAVSLIFNEVVATFTQSLSRVPTNCRIIVDNGDPIEWDYEQAYPIPSTFPVRQSKKIILGRNWKQISISSWSGWGINYVNRGNEVIVTAAGYEARGKTFEFPFNSDNNPGRDGGTGQVRGFLRFSIESGTW